MTDARLPERWLNDRRLQRLSAEHYRAFINALLWSVANRTDGRIELEDVGLIQHWSANAAQALVDSELFTPQPTGWLITDYATTQTSRSDLETLERIRQRDRQKKQQKRANPGDGPRERPGDASPGTAQEGRQAGRKASKGTKTPAAVAVYPSSNGSPPENSGNARDWPQWRGRGADPFEDYR